MSVLFCYGFNDYGSSLFIFYISLFNNNINIIAYMKPNIGSDLKIIVVGNPSTGKTSLVNKWISGHFTPNYKATIASQFNYKIIQKDEIFYRIQIWDLAGQDRDGTVTKVFCKDTQGVFIVCEVNNDTSLQDTLQWKKVIEQEIQSLDQASVPIMLIQNKMDLLSKPNENEEKFLEFGKDNGFIASYRTSAKTGDNIDQAMNFLFEEILKQSNSDYPTEKLQRKSTALNKPLDQTKKEKGCCGKEN